MVPIFGSESFASSAFDCHFVRGSVSRLAGAGTMEALKQVVPEVFLGACADTSIARCDHV